jgi:ADP-ribose 1''-phosphate phosphatase
MSLIIKEQIGDIFNFKIESENAKNILLVHACNCIGSWGAGIAYQFKKRYPIAYDIYHKHCIPNGTVKNILGSCLIIPPYDDKHQQIYCLFIYKCTLW